VIENVMKQSPFIEQIMVIGENEKMPGAFIQPSFDYIKNWGKKNNIEVGNSFQEICENPKVIKVIKKEILKFNEKFGNWEQIKRFELTPELWNVENGHLTPTMKLKRKIIMDKYRQLYIKIYDGVSEITNDLTPLKILNHTQNKINQN